MIVGDDGEGLVDLFDWLSESGDYKVWNLL